MKKPIYIIIGLVVIVVAVWVVWLSSNSSFFPSSSPATVQEPYEIPPLGETYTNDTYRFSLTLPEGFSAREMPAQVGTTIVLEDEKANGIQVTILPFDEDLHTLTKERIGQDLPDLVITDEQPVEIGENDTGLAFKSDNPAFDGASREVWFVFRGNLYQISTYDRLDNLLQTMFTTWKFF